MRDHRGAGVSKLRPVVAGLALVLLAVSGQNMHAQVPVLNYSGQVAVRGEPFTGTGYFVFSLQETNGVIWWKSGELPFEGLTTLVPGALQLPVSKGLYQTRLGEPALGMPRLDLGLLRRALSPRLYIWFNDGTNGWHRLTEQPAMGAVLGLEPEADSAPLTRAEANALRQEMRQLRALMGPAAPALVTTDPPPGPTATVSIKGCPSLGSTNAPLVLVEFSDFECPYCKEAHETSIAAVRQQYVETGKLRLVFRHLPMSFHAHAESAARAAYCAAQQERFWPMHDLLFALSPALGATNLITSAQTLNLDAAAFRACLEAPPSLEFVKKQSREASLAGIRGTPAYVLGRESGDQVTGDLLSGVQPLAFLDRQIQNWLGE